MSEGTPKRPSFGSKMFGGAKNLTPTKVPSFTMARKGSKAAEPTGVGGAVWVRDDEVCYRLATVTDVSGGEMKVRVNDTGATLSGKDFHPLDPQDEQEADLVQMAHVDTPNILHTLRVRHAQGAVYTSVGQLGIVISVNPCAHAAPGQASRARTHAEPARSLPAAARRTRRSTGCTPSARSSSPASASG